MAGLSVEYLTRLEQGRDRNPSVQVLVSLADALRLTPDERIHLRHLAKVTSGGLALCPAATQAPARTVRPAVRALLDRLEPAPAALFNRLGEVIDHTTGFERLFGPIGLLDGDPPNLTRYVFTDVRARIAFPDWDKVADEQAAALKYETGADDSWAGELVDLLAFAAGEAFTGRLAASSGPPRQAPVQRVAHPRAGELRLARSRSTCSATTSASSSTCRPTPRPRRPSTASPAATPAPCARSAPEPFRLSAARPGSGPA
ncbi:helix-turn-helix domain-containing protein [Nonomuraea rubra]|uniref:helix-turn-helix domain-containing protein n=1 Tax=Nonomuraea rubra TaxID=46180 RepID=UPI003615808C